MNYLTWRFVLKYMPYLNQRFSRIYSEFRREVPDPNESTRTYFSRWKECVAIANEGFGMVLGSLYANTYFSESMENEVGLLKKPKIPMFRTDPIAIFYVRFTIW